MAELFFTVSYNDTVKCGLYGRWGYFCAVKLFNGREKFWSILSEKELSLLYETLLSAPGMREVVKIDLLMPRKNGLLLAKVIEKGLQTKPGEAVDGLARVAGANSLEGPQQISVELLHKAGLSEMNEKLQTLQSK